MDAKRTLEGNKSLKHRFYLLLLLLLYLLIRVPLILSPLEENWGEFSRGEMAHRFIHGMRLPFWDHAADAYGIGSLVAASLTVPFFKLFGETQFAYRLVPFFWQLLSVWGWYWVWKSFYSPRKAFLITLFLVLPPPLIMKYSLSNIGYHFDLLLWTALMLLLFRGILEGRVSQKGGGFLLGLLGGISSAIILTGLLTVTLILAYWIFHRGNYLKKKVFYGTFFLGFFLGWSPWLLLNWHFGWSGSHFIFWVFSQEGYFKGFLVGFYRFFRWICPSFFGFDPLPQNLGLPLAKGFALLYYFSLVCFGWQQFRKGFFRKRFGLDIEVFGFFFQFILIVFIVLGRHNFFNYYLFPALPFIGMTIVLALESWNKKWCYALVSVWMILSVYGSTHLIRLDRFKEALYEPLSWGGHNSYSIMGLGEKFSHDAALFCEKANAVLSGESHDIKRKFFEDMNGDFLAKNETVFLEKVDPELHSILLDRLRKIKEQPGP